MGGSVGLLVVLLHPKIVFLVKSYISLITQVTFFPLCSEEDVSHTTMHILYWFTPTFLQKKKKIRGVLVLIKDINV